MAIYKTAKKLNFGLPKATPASGQNWTVVVTKKYCEAQDADLSAGCIFIVLYRGSGGSRGGVERAANTPPPIQEFLDTPLIQ